VRAEKVISTDRINQNTLEQRIKGERYDQCDHSTAVDGTRVQNNLCDDCEVQGPASRATKCVVFLQEPDSSCNNHC